MKRTARLLIVLGLATAATASAFQGFRGDPYPTDVEYDGRFTFLRLRWKVGSLRSGSMSSAWNHDYPRAEQHLAQILKEVTLLDARTDGARVLHLDDPELFRYPIAYMWEPGFWTMGDAEAARFREYLLKGGFAIFDDFDRVHWTNFETQLRRVLPEAQFVELDESNPVFDSFFRMETIYFPLRACASGRPITASTRTTTQEATDGDRQLQRRRGGVLGVVRRGTPARRHVERSVQAGRQLHDLRHDSLTPAGLMSPPW